MENTANAQKEYDQFSANTPANLHDQYCGNTHVFKFEKAIFENLLVPKSILDIGCGTGNRLFPYYDKIGVNYLGVERVQQLTENSVFQNKIIKLDLTNLLFSESLTLDLNERNYNFDTVVLFGGVINGLLDTEKRKIAWDNLSKIVNQGQSLVISFPSFPNIYDKIDNGELIRVNETFPYQYYYSYNELIEIFQNLNFVVLYSMSEPLDKNTTLNYFILKK